MSDNTKAETMFTHHLAQYLQYMKPAGTDSDILRVSLQCLADGRENQLAEAVAWIRGPELAVQKADL